MRRDDKRAAGALRWAITLAALAGLCAGFSAQCEDVPGPRQGQSTASAAAPPSAQRVSTLSPGRATLQRRVETLSKALQLDEHQRAQLLVILEQQRAAVAKIWNEASLPQAERAPATRAVEEHTADQIRAILSDKQRERYNPKRPQSAQTPPPDVGKWMDLTRNATQGASK